MWRKFSSWLLNYTVNYIEDPFYFLFKHVMFVFTAGLAKCISCCNNKIPQIRCLNNTNVCDFQFWRLEDQGQGSAGVVSPEASLLGLQMAIFSPGLFSVLTRPWCLFVQIFSSNNDTKLIGLAPTQMTTF